MSTRLALFPASSSLPPLPGNISGSGSATINPATWRRALWLTVACAFITAVLMILPFAIANGGRLTIAADFNQQQVPYNIFSNRAIRQGMVFWHPRLDIGGSFIGNFAFYTLGSPFFWLSLCFPPTAFPYLIGPLLILKYTVAALSAFLYLKFHLHRPFPVMIGALLYAFSGFQTVNLMFNHFHDVVAFFPLLLLALDLTIQRERHGLLALMIAFSAALNYFFFAGEMLFLLLYYFFLYFLSSAKEESKRLPGYLLEGVLGILMAAFLLFPALDWTMAIPRAQSKIFSTGQSLWLFDSGILLNLLKAWLFPADFMPSEWLAYPSYYSSMSLYLPFLGLFPLCLRLLQPRRQSRPLRRLLLVLLLISLVPVLNSAFTGFAYRYYARWFYMPLLLLALVSARSLEELEIFPPEAVRPILKPALFIVGGLLAAAAFLFSLLPAPRDNPAVFGLICNPMSFAFAFGLSAVGLCGSFLWYRGDVRLRAGQSVPEKPETSTKPGPARLISHRLALLLPLLCFCLLTGAACIWTGWTYIPESQPNQVDRDIVDLGEAAGKLLREGSGPDGSRADLLDYRVKAAEGFNNVPMVGDLPSVNSFISTASPSLFQFYDSVGQGRFIASISDEPALRLLLGARYLISVSPRGDLPLWQKGTLSGGQAFYIYEYPDHLPLAMAVKNRVDPADFMQAPFPERARLLLFALPLTSDQLARLGVADTLRPVSDAEEMESLRLAENTEGRQILASRLALPGLHLAAPQAHGYQARWDGCPSGAGQTVLLSIPCDKGWHANFNGRALPPENCCGLMVLHLPSEAGNLSLRYDPPGLRAGLICSVLGWLLFGLWCMLERRASKRQLRHDLPAAKL